MLLFCFHTVEKSGKLTVASVVSNQSWEKITIEHNGWREGVGSPVAVIQRYREVFYHGKASSINSIHVSLDPSIINWENSAIVIVVAFISDTPVRGGVSGSLPIQIWM